jgi:hypothetical protein
MFQVTRVNDRRLDVVYSGKITEESFQLLVDHMFNASTGFKHGRVLYRLEDFHRPDWSALAAELSRISQLFMLVRRFDRCALVADKKWVRLAGKIEGALIPGVQIKAFKTGEQAAAEAWLEQE